MAKGVKRRKVKVRVNVKVKTDWERETKNGLNTRTAIGLNRMEDKTTQEKIIKKQL